MKTNKLILTTIIFLAFASTALAQGIIEGTVYEKTANGERTPLPGVNVYWKIANVGTVTDEHGHYSI